MNEKTLIKSKKSSIVSLILIIGICLLLLAVILRVVFPNWRIIDWKSITNEPAPTWMFFDSLYAPVMGMDWVICPMVYIGIIAIIFSFVLLISYRNVSLTVTDHRVYGIAKWGKRVDLPLDKISAVATTYLGGIAVSTSSGAIRFIGIKNNMEIHETISKLLLERQNKPRDNAPTIKQEIQQSNADELKKFKDLLDNGIITKEEYDAKKKQLLGL